MIMKFKHNNKAERRLQFETKYAYKTVYTILRKAFPIPSHKSVEIKSL